MNGHIYQPDEMLSTELYRNAYERQFGEGLNYMFLAPAERLKIKVDRWLENPGGFIEFEIVHYV